MRKLNCRRPSIMMPHESVRIKRHRHFVSSLDYLAAPYAKRALNSWEKKTWLRWLPKLNANLML
jgi:hypothetical protein